MHACKHLSLSLSMYIYSSPSEACAVRRAGVRQRRAEYTDTQAHTSYILYIYAYMHACMQTSLSLSLYVYISSPSEAWAVRRAGAR